MLQEAGRLLGAQRLLLVLDGGDDGPAVAGMRLPPAERCKDLLRAVAPWLEEARQSRECTLRHGPAGAARTVPPS